MSLVPQASVKCVFSVTGQVKLQTCTFTHFQPVTCNWSEVHKQNQ